MTTLLMMMMMMMMMSWLWATLSSSAVIATAGRTASHCRRRSSAARRTSSTVARTRMTSRDEFAASQTSLVAQSLLSFRRLGVLHNFAVVRITVHPSPCPTKQPTPAKQGPGRDLAGAFVEPTFAACPSCIRRLSSMERRDWRYMTVGALDRTVLNCLTLEYYSRKP